MEKKEEQPQTTEKDGKQYEVIKKTPEERKAEKEEKKRLAAEAKAAKAASKQKAQASDAEFVKDPNDPCAHLFGDLPICRSDMSEEERAKRVYVAIKDINAEHEDKTIRVRGRVQTSRAKGKMAFIVARSSFATVQVVLFVGDTISKGMVTYASKIPRESIVEIVAKVVKPSAPIDGCSIQYELHVVELWTFNKSAPVLPFQIEDASR